jgi:RNA polymerase-binding transcription factor DksA
LAGSSASRHAAARGGEAGGCRHQQRLVALNETLRLMGDGNYGMCARCREDIEYSRLESAPKVVPLTFVT